MCGRYIPNTEDEIMEIREILKEISIRLSQSELQNNEDVYPSKITPAIYMDDEYTIMDKAKFGFEKWDKKGVIFNAKSETVTQSKFFNPFIDGNRCIIPAHSYYEWQTMADKQKIKYEFYSEEQDFLLMAGIYRQNHDNREFVILTKQANESIQTIHPRMPVILQHEYVRDWLNGKLNVSNINDKLDSSIYYKKSA